MNIKYRNPLIFILTFIAGLILYWPVMQAPTLWDDSMYWFRDPYLKDVMTYSIIWKNNAWPLSVTIQKLLLNWWGENYFNYHLLNLVLHFFNSFLIYKLSQKFKFKYSMLFFLIFFFHPVTVICTAWMIQLKTLISFACAIGALLIFLKDPKSYKWVGISTFLYFCSIASKSSSLMLPFLMLFLSFKAYRFKALHLVIPVFLISLLSVQRLMGSKITAQSMTHAEKLIELKKTATAKNHVPDPPAKTVAPPVVSTAVIDAEMERVKKLDNQILDLISTPMDRKSKLNFTLPIQTLNYYFWQAVFPLNNVPVRGLNFDPLAWDEVANLAYLIFLIILFRKKWRGFYLVSSLILLIPFLGLVTAPFMNVTWVSDQHLYMVLPFIIAFWMSLLEKMKWKFNYSIPVAFIIFSIYQSSKAIPYYKDELIFYGKSLEYNPMNVPISYNLILVHLKQRNFTEAYALMRTIQDYTDEEPMLKKSTFYVYLQFLRRRMNDALKEE